MKIVRHTPEQLILRNVPWAMAIAISAAILGLMAWGFFALAQGDYTQCVVMLLCAAFMGLFFALFVRRDDLILDRSRNLIELRHASVFGRYKVRHMLEHLEKALVQTQTTASRGAHSTGGGPTHRVALVLNGGMDAGTHPATEIYTSGKGAHRAVDAINAWLYMNVDSGIPEA